MSLADALRAEIARDGPMPVARWMARCNAHYYATRDPFGAGGDFVTAPEVSQMFGELIGVWAADLWVRAGSPGVVRLVELGPGRGTLMADLRRATARVPGFAAAARVHFVETSPVLRRAQAARVPEARWHDELADVPADAPAIVVANEFFDALPVRQFVKSPLPAAEAGREARDERTVSCYDGGFVPDATGEIFEDSPARCDIAATLGGRLAARGGAALIIDYGYAQGPAGDTLQAVRGHARVDPFADPGEADLTALVDFGALAEAARPAVAHGPVAQGIWLERLGIGARAAALKSGASIETAARIEAGRRRLTAPAAMGMSFKALALTAPGWPVPAGFQ